MRLQRGIAQLRDELHLGLGLTEPRAGRPFRRLFTVGARECMPACSEEHELTEGPHRLLPRPALEQESAGGLEDEIALYGGNALELRRERVQDAGIEWRALRDVLGV